MSLHSQSHTCIHHYVPECATKMIRLSMWQCSGIGCPPFPHHIPATIPLLQPELDGRDACIGIEGGGSYVTEEGGGGLKYAGGSYSAMKVCLIIS